MPGIPSIPVICSELSASGYCQLWPNPLMLMIQWRKPVAQLMSHSFCCLQISTLHWGLSFKMMLAAPRATLSHSTLLPVSHAGNERMATRCTFMLLHNKFILLTNIVWFTKLGQWNVFKLRKSDSTVATNISTLTCPYLLCFDLRYVSCAFQQCWNDLSSSPIKKSVGTYTPQVHLKSSFKVTVVRTFWSLWREFSWVELSGSQVNRTSGTYGTCITCWFHICQDQYNRWVVEVNTFYQKAFC